MILQSGPSLKRRLLVPHHCDKFKVVRPVCLPVHPWLKARYVVEMDFTLDLWYSQNSTRVAVLPISETLRRRGIICNVSEIFWDTWMRKPVTCEWSTYVLLDFMWWLGLPLGEHTTCWTSCDGGISPVVECWLAAFVFINKILFKLLSLCLHHFIILGNRF